MENNDRSTTGLPGHEAPRRRLPLMALIAVGGLLLVAVGLLLASRLAGQGSAAAPKVATSARLAVDREEIDFGDVPVNQKVKAVFTLTNEGDEPLQVVGEPKIEVKEGC